MTSTSEQPLRLAALISGSGRTVINILDQIEAGELNAQIVCVIASRPCSGVERCQLRGLPVKVIPYKAFRDAEGGPDLQGYADAITAHLDAAGAELVLLSGFLSPYLIPPHYAGKVMNIHPALLPKFGGKGFFGHHVHEAVLAAGEKESGCTVHFVTNEYDAGPIILQRHVPVLPDDTADTLAARVFEQECLAYPEAIRRFADGELS